VSRVLNEEGNFEGFIFSPSQSREQSPTQPQGRGTQGSLVLFHFLKDECLMERDSIKGLELQLQLLSENLCHEPFIYLREECFVLANSSKRYCSTVFFNGR